MKALLAFIAVTACAAAQTRQADILPLMQEIVQGLGVQCDYCHSARGSGLPEPKKDIAPAMRGRPGLPDVTQTRWKRAKLLQGQYGLLDTTCESIKPPSHQDL